MNEFCERFDPVRLDKLKRCIKANNCPEWNKGTKPRTFVEKVFDSVKIRGMTKENRHNLQGVLQRLKEQFRIDPGKFTDGKVMRGHVRCFVKDSENEILNKVLYILAWGGMRPQHAQLALNSFDGTNGGGHWKEIVEHMDQKKINDIDAYSKFHSLRINNNLKGMGPAFFTKLIFFLGQPLNSPGKGYIMDQWLAKSINLLRRDNANQIALIQGGYVANNDADVYGTFCNDLEALANCLEKTPEEIEIILFSNRGCCWRKYVRQHG